MRSIKNRLLLKVRKKSIITLLLALVAMAVQAKGNCDSIHESLVDTYWRNEVTGDWDIGFTESCASYGCQLWKYREVKAKGKGLMLTLENGRETLGVTIGKQKDGKCQMSIGGLKKQTYEHITTRTLPLYPQPDQTPYKDNGFREGDSATLIGWIKDYPALKGKGRQLKIYYGGFITGESESAIAEMDSLGRFKVKVPIENTQMVTVVVDEDPYIIETLMEPDDTCFVLFDGKNNQYLYMGRNARVLNELNELGTARLQMASYHESDEENLSDVQLQARIEQCKDVYRTNEEKIDSVMARHPTLSRKYEDFFRMVNVSRLTNGILQISANSHFKIPQAEIDDMLAAYRKNVRKPYTISSDFNFHWRYLQQAVFTCPQMQTSIHIDKDYILQLEKEGFLSLSAEDRNILEKGDSLIKKSGQMSKTESKTMFAHNNELMKGWQSIMRRKDVNTAIAEKMEAEDIERDFEVADSIFSDPILRECAKANRIYGV